MTTEQPTNQEQQEEEQPGKKGKKKFKVNIHVYPFFMIQFVYNNTYNRTLAVQIEDSVERSTLSIPLEYDVYRPI